MLSGREFNDADGASGVPAAIVNQLFASKVLAGRRPARQTSSVLQANTPEAVADSRRRRLEHHPE